MFENNLKQHYVKEDRRNGTPLKSALANKDKPTPYNSKKNVSFCSETVVFNYPKAEYDEDEYDYDEDSYDSDQEDEGNGPTSYPPADYGNQDSVQTDDYHLHSVYGGASLCIPRVNSHSSGMIMHSGMSNNDNGGNKRVVKDWNYYPPEDYRPTTPSGYLGELPKPDYPSSNSLSGGYPYTAPPTPYTPPTPPTSYYGGDDRSVASNSSSISRSMNNPYNSRKPSTYSNSSFSAANYKSKEKVKQEKKVKELEKKSKNCCCSFIYKKKLKEARKKLSMM